MIARADYGRGLARQTHSFWKHLQPDVTVVVDMSLIDKRGQWPQDFSVYPGAIRTEWKGYTAHFENPDAVAALRECDLIYTAETYYDPRLEKVPAILHVNPEFYRGEPAAQYWYPTTWETNRLPPGHIVPTPIDDDDIAYSVPSTDRLLHVGGHAARMDRNGTRLIQGLLPRLRHSWRLASQDGIKIRPELLQFVEIMGNVADHWALYQDCGVLVYPRRYGGQSLQVNEAMARGLAVIMPDCPPNIDTWPIITVPARQSAAIVTPGGKFFTHQANVHSLGETITALISDSERLERFQARSLAWARDNAWSQWKPKIQELVYG